MDAVSFYSQILNYFIIPSEFFLFTSVCFFWTTEGFSNAWWSLVVSRYLSMGHWKVGLKLCLPGLYVLVVGFTVGRTALALSLGTQLSVSVGLVAFFCETPANFLPRVLKSGSLHSGRWVWEWGLGAHGSVYQLSLSSPAFARAPWLSTIPAPQFRSSLVRPQRRVNTQVSATVEVGIWVAKCFLYLAHLQFSVPPVPPLSEVAGASNSWDFPWFSREINCSWVFLVTGIHLLLLNHNSSISPQLFSSERQQVLKTSSLHSYCSSSLDSWGLAILELPQDHP